MSADAVDMWSVQDARQRRKLNRCPVCDSCGERIQDGYYYSIGGDILCRSCLDDEYRRDVDNDE